MANAGTYNHTKEHFAEGAAAATPDTGEVVIYAKSDGHMYQKDDAGTETDLAAGGGGLTHAYLGYNTIGGTTEAVTALRWYAKKITVAAAGIITSIGAYLDQTASGATTNVVVGLFEDNAGDPRYLLAANSTNSGTGVLTLQHNSAAAGDPRWYHTPLGLYVPAADYWIGVTLDSTSYNVYKDTSGTDRYWTQVTGIRVRDAGFVAITTTTDRYSIRASIIT